MAFRVGQKVVCVDGAFHPRWSADPATPHLPRQGAIYTVRAVLRWDFRGYHDTGVLLDEIINPVERWDDGEIGEHPFWAERFRPIVDRKREYDISIFHEILRKSSAPITDDAFHASHDLGQSQCKSTEQKAG